MTDPSRTKQELLEENTFLNQRIKELEQAESEHKRVEEALRESEEHYRTLFDEALDGICLADAKTGFIFDCNQALAALVCREQAELIGQPQTILHPPQDDKTALSPTFKQHLADKEGHILETQIVTKTGEIREVEIKANLLDIHGRKLLQGLFHDITERKRAEEALRESEEGYRNLFENANEAIFVAQDGKLVFLNPKTATMTDYSAEELMSRPFIEFIHPDDRDMVIDRHFRRMKGEEIPPLYPFRIIHRDGNVRWVELNAVFIN